MGKGKLRKLEEDSCILKCPKFKQEIDVTSACFQVRLEDNFQTENSERIRLIPGNVWYDVENKCGYFCGAEVRLDRQGEFRKVLQGIWCSYRKRR